MEAGSFKDFGNERQIGDRTEVVEVGRVSRKDGGMISHELQSHHPLVANKDLRIKAQASLTNVNIKVYNIISLQTDSKHGEILTRTDTESI